MEGKEKMECPHCGGRSYCVQYAASPDGLTPYINITRYWMFICADCSRIDEYGAFGTGEKRFSFDRRSRVSAHNPQRPAQQGG